MPHFHSLKRALLAFVLFAALPALTLAQSANGNLSTLEAGVTLPNPNRYGTATVDISGTFSQTLAFRVYGSSWGSVQCVNVASGSAATSTTGTGKWVCPTSGWVSFGVFASAVTSGTAVIEINFGPNGGGLSTGGGGALANAAAPTWTEGNQVALSVDLAGNLRTTETRLSAAASPTDNFANPTTSQIFALMGCWDGSAWDRCTSGTEGTHGSTASTTGPQGLLEAASDFSANTAVTDGQAVRAVADLLGRQLTVGPCDKGARLRTVTTIIDGSSTSAIPAQGAGIVTEVWDVVIANTSATAVTVDLRDGTAGSVLATFPVPANTNGIAFPITIPITGTANTAIAADPSALATSIVVSLGACKAK